jgi:predicted O-methyltransferase YrrM
MINSSLICLTFAAMLSRIGLYIRYWIHSKGPNRVHSPFVFNLYTNVILSDKHFYTFQAIEKIRAQLLTSEQIISDPDPGAGSKGVLKTRKVKVIAANSLLSPKQGRILFRLIEHFQPKVILELGSSLGISALYLANASKAAVHTVEGQESIAKIAKSVFNKGKVETIQLHIGLFEDVLPNLLNSLKSIDFLYMDGNHTYEATLRYFEQIRPYLNDNSIIVVDDIRWSVPMMNAWETLSKEEDIHVSIDLQKFGILFFRKSQVKEHFILSI